MCGINGLINLNISNEDSVKRQLMEMNELIHHRGPDSEGQFVYKSTGFTVGMAMKRLSIIDLGGGDQPMYSDDKSIALVFNGEIYNYLSIKTHLQERNIKFNTKSDTEVILKLYETYGPEGFSRLDGMYAFSLTDLNSNKVYLGRDYFGEKPLYYYKGQKQFYWASELKSIVSQIEAKPKICNKALSLYFRLTYIPSPYTIYKDIYKLEPNSLLTVNLLSLELSSQEIQPKKTIAKSELSFNQASEITRSLVYESVVSRSISDVSIGTFLSGGVDSSIVSWCLADHNDQKINTFSIGFDTKGYDETDKSREVAKLINSNHHEFVIDESMLQDQIDQILLNFDEPFADSSALPTYLVANKTASKVKVALTGDGGDEIFGGYNKYYIGRLNKKYTSVVPQVIHRLFLNGSKSILKQKSDIRGSKYRLKRLLESINYNDNYYWDIISLGMTELELNQFLTEQSASEDLFSLYKEKTDISRPNSLNDYRLIDKEISLEGDMLVKVDRTSMLNSLECRAPFLSKKLFDFSLSLPEHYLLKGYNKKHILKHAFQDVFPDGFLEKPKKGFGIPVGNWLRHSLKDELLSYVDKTLLERQGLFNVEQVSQLVNNHIDGKVDNSFKVWAFYCFQKWYLNTYNKGKTI